MSQTQPWPDGELAVFSYAAGRDARLAADYPYYRDAPSLWRRKLTRLMEGGVKVVTSYVPWRHHESIGSDGQPTFVFSGVDDNRDLQTFLTLVSELGLSAILKPGPFVHAEVAFGGFPDRLDPEQPNSPEPLRERGGSLRRYQGYAIPAPLDPLLQREAQSWLSAFAREVVARHAAPAGCVIAVQPWNEGACSDANLSPAADDASRAAEQRRAALGVSEAAWPARYLAEVWRSVADATTRQLPLLANVAPPNLHDLAAANAWMARCDVPRWGGVRYGFSSWIGNVLGDDVALASLLLAAGWWPGPQMEENWGFLWHDKRYAAGVTQAHHAVAVLGAGALGLTAYPGCATSAPSPRIMLSPARLAALGGDVVAYEPPYGSAAPVGPSGEPGPLWPTLRLLGRWLEVAPRLTAAAALPAVALAVSPLRAGSCAAAGALEDSPAQLAHRMLMRCVRAGRLGQVLPLGSPHLPSHAVPLLVFESDLEYAADQRAALDDWVRRGGKLLVIRDLEVSLDQLGLSDSLPPAPMWWTTRVDSVAETTYVFVLNRSECARTFQERVDGELLSLQLCGYGSAIVQLRQQRVVAALAKGHNELTSQKIALELQYGGRLQRLSEADAVWHAA